MNSWCIPCSRFSQIWAVWRFEERISGSLLRSAESSVANRRNVNFIRTCHLKKSIKSVQYTRRLQSWTTMWCKLKLQMKSSAILFLLDPCTLLNSSLCSLFQIHNNCITHDLADATLTHEDTNTIITICQCKWRHPMAKFPTIARSAPWWPNSYYCKWRHLVAKFLPL